MCVCVCVRSIIKNMFTRPKCEHDILYGPIFGPMPSPTTVYMSRLDLEWYLVYISK